MPQRCKQRGHIESLRHQKGHEKERLDLAKRVSSNEVSTLLSLTVLAGPTGLRLLRSRRIRSVLGAGEGWTVWRYLDLLATRPGSPFRALVDDGGRLKRCHFAEGLCQMAAL